MAPTLCCGLISWGRELEPIPEEHELTNQPDNATSRSDSYATAQTSNQDPRFITCDIWAAAYDALKEDHKFRALIENYEEFFDTVLWPTSRQATIVTDAAGNPASDGNGEQSTTRRVRIIEDDNTVTSSSQSEEPAKRSRAATEMSEKRFRTAAQLYSEIAAPGEKAAGIASSAVEFIGRIKVAVDAVLAGSPPASMAWAGVCLVVLPIVLNHSEQIAAKQAGFDYVMARFYWYDQVLALLDRDHWKNHHNFTVLRQGIRDEIINLYKLLIEYQLRAYYAYCRPLVTITRDVFKLDDWDGMILNIKAAEQRLQEYMDLNFEQNVLDNLHSLSEDALRRQRNEMALKFKFPDELPYDVYQSYLDGIPPLHEGTGHGVTTHPKFLKWSTSTFGLFLLSGIPGSGKSVLAKSLLTDLPRRRGTTVCSFFFKDNANGQDLATTALCRILDEVFASQITLIDRVIPRIEHLLPQEIRCNLSLLWSILLEATAETDQGEFTIVLDAIDECDPDDAISLCNMINSYIKKPDARLKFFVTTRPVVLFGQPFDARSIYVVRSNEDYHCLRCISDDIDKVVASRFEEFARVCIQDPELEARLCRLIEPKGERTYLYAKLVFDYLDVKVREGLPRVPYDWLEVFQNLPTTIREAYSDFLANVREAHREDVRLMLQMVVAAARPLTVGEINIALNIRDQKWGSPRGLGLQPQNSFRDWILDACRCLLDVHNGRVYFIHKTARDYLLAEPSGNRSSPPEWLGSFTIENCHATLAESCLAFLCLPLACAGKFTNDDLDNSRHLWTVQDLEFSNYASVYYRSHLTSSNVLCEDENVVLPVGISERLAFVRSWSREFLTTVISQFPPNLAHMIDYDKIDDILEPDDVYDPLPERKKYFSDVSETDETDNVGLQILLTEDDKGRVVFKTAYGQPYSRILRIPMTSTNLVETVANAVYTLSLFRSVSSISEYQKFSPIPRDWFTVRITGVSLNPDGTRQTTAVRMRLGKGGSCNLPAVMNLRHGDTLSYVLTNKTNSIPVSAHMVCLTSSWAIEAPIWNEQILPGQEKSGSLAMIVPSKVNDSDQETVADEFLIIFVVGENQSGRNGWDNLEDWLKTVFTPPNLPPSMNELGEIRNPWRASMGLGLGRHLPFIPPPNWQVWRFSVKVARTFPRVRATI